MKETLRMMAAGATGAVLAAAVLVGQPSLAGVVHAKTAAKNSVTSKSIKNGTIQSKDLNAATNASLAKANTALQSVPDNSVTSAKIADGQVGSADVTDNSLAAADLAADSVGSSELANNSVGAGNVTDHVLTANDVAVANGVLTFNFGNINAGTCASTTVNTGNTLAGDLYLVSAHSDFPDGVMLSARPNALITTTLAIVACNWTGGAIDPPNQDFSWAVIENN